MKQSCQLQILILTTHRQCLQLIDLLHCGLTLALDAFNITSNALQTVDDLVRQRAAITVAALNEISQPLARTVAQRAQLPLIEQTQEPLK
ncbi:hypothetical protein D3C85_898770 [compost metagenome]